MYFDRRSILEAELMGVTIWLSALRLIGSLLKPVCSTLELSLTYMVCEMTRCCWSLIWLSPAGSGSISFLTGYYYMGI